MLKTQSSTDGDDEGFDIPLVVGDDPHHCGHRTEKSNSLLNFCGEAYIELSRMLAEKYSISDGDSVRVESPVGKIIVSARVSNVIRNNVVFIPRNFSSTQVSSLLMRKRRIDMVRLTKVETT